MFGVPMPFLLAMAYMLISGLIGEMIGAPGALFYSFIPGAVIAVVGFIIGLIREKDSKN